MSDVKFIFVRDHNNFPVGCFAYGDVLESPDGNLKGMKYGYSIYFFGDRFNRARARQVAQGRLEKDPRVIYGNGPQEEMVLEMLKVTPKTGYHQWAKVSDEFSSNGKSSRSLGHRFMKACKRTAEKLTAVMKQKAAA